MTRIDINNMPRKGKRKGQHREKSGTIDAADSDSIGSSEEELQTDLPQTPKKGKRQMKRARGREESEEEFHDSEEEFHDSEESDEQGRQATRRGMLRKKAKVEVKKREALATCSTWYAINYSTIVVYLVIYLVPCNNNTA